MKTKHAILVVMAVQIVMLMIGSVQIYFGILFEGLVNISVAVIGLGINLVTVTRMIRDEN